MACIINTDGSVKTVKNLGWLLKNWQIVESFEVFGAESLRWQECVLVAHLKDGRKYSTNWASRMVCRDWLTRPVFRTLPLIWFGEETTC